jgi:hypothetical protein
MAGIGQDARPFADALADLTADAAAATSHAARTTVSDAAVWALTRIGDPRGIPELGSRLKADRTGFPPVNTSFRRRVGRNAAFTASLPSIGAVVTDSDPGARLLDLVIERLRAAAGGTDPVLAAILCETLGAWGPRAAPAVPQLHQVLRESTPGRHLSQAAAAALGRNRAGRPRGSSRPTAARTGGLIRGCLGARASHWRHPGSSGRAHRNDPPAGG